MYLYSDSMVNSSFFLPALIDAETIWDAAVAAMNKAHEVRQFMRMHGLNLDEILTIENQYIDMTAESRREYWKWYEICRMTSNN